jgi:two-component system, NtrC family, nitrogen regulation response regulator NtrX
MISGHGTIETAVEATRRGAYDFLEKPLDTDRILLVLRNALQQRGLLEENARLRGEVESRHEIVGRSFAIRQVLERVERVAPTDARVLITGENGTGKELVARAIHRLSRARSEPFVEVNCAAIPTGADRVRALRPHEGLLHRRHEDRAGKFELADGGTLFLDEVGDMSLAAQAKVLRALQEGIVTRVGGAQADPVDVRVLAATNKDLPEEIREGRFREDLFHRLNVIPLHVPPLRERREDIPMLVQHFAEPPCARRTSPRSVHRRGARAAAADGLVRATCASCATRRAAADPRRPGDRSRRTTSSCSSAASRAAPALGRPALLRDLRRVQGRGRARLHPAQAARERLERLGDGALLDMPRSNLYKKIEKYELVRED